MSQQNHEYLDVVKLLVKNFREDKPLLDGAVLFHGSRFGDQTPGKDSPDMLHAHLLPQVAASYTHNWQKGDAFIDTYPIDRENTKFFANLNLDNHLKGEKATAYSVQDVERGIRPMVENLAYLPSISKGYEQNVERLEKFIKSSFYEAGVPVQRDGEQPKPQDKFYYTGDPTATSTKDVLNNMERVTPVNEARAKEAFAMGRSSDAAKAIDGIDATHPEASRAFQVLRGAVQRDQASNVLAKHGDKPLMDFVTATRNEPSSDSQSRVLRLAQGLAQSLDSQDHNVRTRALTVTGQLAKLDPDMATLKDVGQQVSKVNQSVQAASREETREQAAANFINQKSEPSNSQERGFAR
jgi:alpha-ketoglutarate-dependent taurine dioxygenase